HAGRPRRAHPDREGLRHARRCALRLLAQPRDQLGPLRRDRLEVDSTSESGDDMRRLRRLAWILTAPLVLAAPLGAVDQIDARIAGDALAGGGAAAFLETLTDTVGGRVTGTPESLKASTLILDALKRAGYENARFEEAPLESRWTRGPAAGRIVSPISRAIAVG